MSYLFNNVNYIYDTNNNNYLSLLLVMISICIIIIVLLLKKEFKNKNQNMRCRDDFLSSLYSNVDEVFLVFDNINKKYEYISPNCESILGISSAEFHRNKFALFDHTLPEQKEEFVLLFTSAKVVTSKKLVIEYCHPVTNRKLWLLIRTLPVYMDNTVSRYITNIYDVTKEIQDQAEFREALSAARIANDAKTEFISHMSHELKTPMNGILGMTHIAMNSLEDHDKVKSCLEKIDFSSRNLISMINNILDTAKHNRNKLVLIEEPFYLLKTIAEFSAMMATQAEVKTIDYKLIYHKMENDYLVGDSLRITQILGNCLSNAIKFTPCCGYITLEISEVESSQQNALYRFIISDSGKGMDEEYINHIFEPFVQEDNTISRKFGGSGLGMSIVKTLLDLMGGTIKIESKVGIGTTITIEIRLTIAAKLNEEQEQNYKFWNFSKQKLQEMRVLVVEDNEINLEITTEYLKFFNIQVDSATNGYDALKCFEASEQGYYTAILMDLQMPEINGYKTSQLIRTSGHPDANSVFILAMTADTLVDHYSCIQQGINHHITKPIDIDHFYPVLRAIKDKEL